MKYVFTGETKLWFGITLKRIKRISDGLEGGWIEKEENLAQVSGNAWVSGNARVSGDAQVSGNAWVSGDARVYGDARVACLAALICVSNLTYHITFTKQQIVVGCQAKTYSEWTKVTKKQAKEMGLPESEYSLFKSLIKLLYPQIKE